MSSTVAANAPVDWAAHGLQTDFSWSGATPMKDLVAQATQAAIARPGTEQDGWQGTMEVLLRLVHGAVIRVLFRGETDSMCPMVAF